MAVSANGPGAITAHGPAAQENEENGREEKKTCRGNVHIEKKKSKVVRESYIYICGRPTSKSNFTLCKRTSLLPQGKVSGFRDGRRGPKSSTKNE